MRQVGRTTHTIDEAVKATRQGKQVWLVLATAAHRNLVSRQIQSYEDCIAVGDGKFRFKECDGELRLTTKDNHHVDLLHGRVTGFRLDTLLVDHYALELWLSNTWAARELAKINEEAYNEVPNPSTSMRGDIRFL